MVPGAGLEPARSKERGILNPLCLPISPPGRIVACKFAVRWNVAYYTDNFLFCKYFFTCHFS